MSLSLSPKIGKVNNQWEPIGNFATFVKSETVAGVFKILNNS
jgi:hypothetical protein